MKKRILGLCPCCSQATYESCCGLYFQSPGRKPPSPEALMRSRYTAYTLANVNYIAKTMRGKALHGFNKIEARKWAKRVSWTGLRVIKTSPVVLNKGYVEFIASFIEDGKLQTMHEVSEFVFEDGAWFYVEGVQGSVR